MTLCEIKVLGQKWSSFTFPLSIALPTIKVLTLASETTFRNGPLGVPVCLQVHSCLSNLSSITLFLPCILPLYLTKIRWTVVSACVMLLIPLIAVWHILKYGHIMNCLVFSLLLDPSLDNYTQFFNRCLHTYIGRMFVEVFFFYRKKI